MAQQTINIGSAANDGTGTTARDAFDMCNDNFTELYASVAARRSGRIYPILRNVRVTAGTASQSGQIRCTPFPIFQATTITELGSRVTTASAGQNFQLAIYANDAAAMKPTGVALASTGNVSAAATGGIGAAISQTSVTLQPGLYWFCTNCSDATIALLAIDIATTWGMWTIGESTWANALAGSAQLSIAVAYTQTFGTWPDLTSASPSSYGSSGSTFQPFGGYKVS